MLKEKLEEIIEQEMINADEEDWRVAQSTCADQILELFTTELRECLPDEEGFGGVKVSSLEWFIKGHNSYHSELIQELKERGITI